MKTFTHVTYDPEAGKGDLPERARLLRFLADDGQEVADGDGLAEVEPGP